LILYLLIFKFAIEINNLLKLEFDDNT